MGPTSLAFRRLYGWGPGRSGTEEKASAESSGGLHDTGGGLFSTEACAPSIVSAAAFHFRVRDGNGWVHRALATGHGHYSAARVPSANGGQEASCASNEYERTGQEEPNGPSFDAARVGLGLLVWARPAVRRPQCPPDHAGRAARVIDMSGAPIHILGAAGWRE